MKGNLNLVVEFETDRDRLTNDDPVALAHIVAFVHESLEELFAGPVRVRLDGGAISTPGVGIEIQPSAIVLRALRGAGVQ